MSDQGKKGATPRYPSFSEPTEYVGFTYTATARIACTECGEWIYPRRPVDSGGAFALPPECQVCGYPLKVDRG